MRGRTLPSVGAVAVDVACVVGANDAGAKRFNDAAVGAGKSVGTSLACDEVSVTAGTGSNSCPVGVRFDFDVASAV